MLKTDEQSRVKVRFRLTEVNDGWPPVESEGLWAIPLGKDEFRIDNTPWFVRNLAVDDIVRAQAGSDGVLWAIERVHWSGRLTVRVIPRKDGPLQGDRQAVLDLFEPHGVTGEGVQQYGIVALDIPPNGDLSTLKAMLIRGEEEGRWYYEEGCISAEWSNL